MLDGTFMCALPSVADVKKEKAKKKSSRSRLFSWGNKKEG